MIATFGKEIGLLGLVKITSWSARKFQIQSSRVYCVQVSLHCNDSVIS